MNFQGMRSSDYSGAGKAAADDTVRAFAAARRNAPKYGKIVQAADNFRAGTKQAAIAAQAQVTRTGIDEAGKLEAHNIKLNAKEGLRKAKRKAGVLAAGGKLLAGAGDAFKEPPKYESDSLDYSGQIAKLREKASSYYGQVSQGGGSTTNISSTSTDTKPDSPATPKTSTGKTVSADISAQHSAKGGLSKSLIKQHALDAGFSPQDAATVVGIAGGESGYDPTNSTKRSGLYAKTGEDSVGLMQINWGYHKDSGWLQGLGITKREQLLDPATNMKAAKYLHEGRGNFGDWTVYNKGIYKDYL